jgi:ABC-type nitrate/sulfonate/bicarbonate transport system substrate-binding protein
MGERMLKTWKALVAVLLLPLMAVALIACGSSDDDSSSSSDSTAAAETPAARVEGIDTAKVKKDLTVGVDNPYYLFHEDILIAQEKGYFREYGIDNVRIVETENPLPALIGGSLDFMLYDTDTTMAAAAKSGTTLPYLAVYLGGEANILGVRRGIDNAEDLKGTTITGGQFDSRNDFLMRQLLRENGVDPEKDVKLVSTGGQSNERLQAVIAGTVDGASLQLRHRKLLEDEGGKFLFERTDRVPQVGWSASPELADDPDTMAAFLAATLRAREFITDQANKDEVLGIVRDKGFDLPPDFVAAYGEENAPTYHVVDGGFRPADMDKFVNEQIELRIIPEGTDWHELVNLEPLWTAQRALGIPLNPDPAEMR